MEEWKQQQYCPDCSTETGGEVYMDFLTHFYVTPGGANPKDTTIQIKCAKYKCRACGNVQSFEVPLANPIQPSLTHEAQTTITQ